ncbi:bacillithiol biosynthesis cysteine-adding enzyme BshC [Flexithrix dorotheae]|uniref:bacillithiol biosynthesis cysteine-adding enzyme BshC n=1 Tax=Flexithrix dorotheae TaxID=70993 RepID=UPI00036C64CC|nr:bacillithiol biosynthesis cysteine-adding enzyme BshC [Flexithrix dorotheae]
MRKTNLPFEQTNQFNPIFIDYISENKEVKPFYDEFPKIENFARQIERKSFSKVKREILAQVLQNQYQKISSDVPTSQIELLKDEQTFTVVTGHQLNIFSGPLYFIYKIVSTINLAKQLKHQYPEFNFIPIYWMATEDHDFEEISYFNLFGKKYTWEHPNPTGAVGKLNLNGIDHILNEISELPDFFKTAYTRFENLTDATRYYVNELFGEEGLLILDADDSRLKSEFRNVIYDDLLHHHANSAVEKTNEKLEAAGYKTQVFPRKINFFYHKDGIRERIEKEGEYFQVLNSEIKFSQEEIEKEIEEFPERYSPNVVLRPLYQEIILPNLAYIGGPGELSYWLQLKGVFDHYGVEFPMLVPRNFALYLNKSNCKKIDKLSVDCSELFLEENQLKDNFLKRNAEGEIDLSENISALEQVFEDIAKKAALVDKSLQGFIGAESKKAIKQVENIGKRLKKSEENNQSTAVNQLLNLKSKLFPDNSLQERTDNFMNFYLNDPQFIEKLKDAFDPLHFEFLILQDS